MNLENVFFTIIILQASTRYLQMAANQDCFIDLECFFFLSFPVCVLWNRQAFNITIYFHVNGIKVLGLFVLPFSELKKLKLIIEASTDLTIL